MPPENRLTVCLLGQPRIFWGEKNLNIKRKLARYLFYYLACQKSMVGRADVMLLFWPDEPNARQHLRDLLSKLRSELPEADILQTERDWLGLDFNRITSDVLTFEDIYEQLSLPFLNIENRPLPEAIFQKMLSAVNMWDAPGFMHGIGVLEKEELYDWITEKNRELVSKRLSLMMRIAQHLTLVGDLEGALVWLAKIIESDEDYDYPQAVYHHLNVLYQLGRLTRAYEFGRQYLDLMDSEWFEEYQTPFQTIMKKIQSERSQNQTFQPVSHVSPTGINIPYVGGSDLLAQMQRAFRRGDIIVLSGVTGSGKTRLFQEFLKQLTVKLPVFSMEAVYSERNVPFRPVIELLRQTMNMQKWQKVEKFWLTQLAPILPELQTMVAHNPDYFSLVKNQQVGLYESFRQVLLTLGDQDKILFQIEHAQWLDSETVHLLSYLAQRRFFQEKANLILLSRSEEEDESVFQTLAHSAIKEQVAWIQIPALDLEAIGNIASYLFRNPLSEQQIQRLYEHTGGNPLFVIETLQLVAEDPGQLISKNGDPIPISTNVQFVIRNWLNHLPEKVRLTLNCGALIGNEFCFDYLRGMMDLTDLELAEIMDGLVKKEFISISSQKHLPLCYRFNQLFTREVIFQEISQTQKHLLHKRLANHLIAAYGPKKIASILSDIAYHLDQSGNSLDAFQHWLDAAQAFITLDEKGKAYQAYEQANTLLQDRNLQISDNQMFDLWISWAELASKMNNFNSAAKFYNQAVEVGLSRNSSKLIGSGLSGQGYLFLLRGFPNQARQYLEQAEVHLKDGSMSEYIRISIRKMLTYIFLFDLKTSMAEFESIKWLENQIKTPREQIVFASLRSTVALTYAFAGKFQEAEQEAVKVIATAVEYQDTTLRIEAEFALGLVSYFMGFYNKSLEQLGITKRSAENYYNWRFVLECIVVTSNAYLATGKTFKSLESLQNAFNLAKIYQFTGMHCFLIHVEGKIHLAFGDFVQALAYFEESIKFCQMEYYSLINQLWIAFSIGLQGDLDQGIAALTKLLSDIRHQNWTILELEVRGKLGLLHFLKGNHEQALEVLESFATSAEHQQFAAAGTAYAYIRSKIALSHRNVEEARLMATIILEKGKTEENPWLKWIAMDLLISAAKQDNSSTTPYADQKHNLLLFLNQSKPYKLDLTIDPKQPPLFALV